MKWIFKWLLRLAAVFALLFVGAWQFENWRGKSAWEEALKRAESAGISTDFSVPRKPDIPDEENLLKNKVFLAEWNGEIEPELNAWSDLKLAGFKSGVKQPLWSNPVKGSALDFSVLLKEELSPQEVEQKVDELTSDIQRRTEQLVDLILSYPVHDFDDYGQFDPEIASLEYSSIDTYKISKWGRGFRAHSCLSIRMGRSGKAMRNIRAVHHLAECIRRPALMNSLFANALVSASSPTIWEGIRVHGWNESQLEELEDLLNTYQPIAETDKVFELHLIHGLHMMEHAGKYFKPQMFASKNRDRIFYIGDNQESDFGLSIRHAVGTGGPEGWTMQRKSILLNSYIEQMVNRSVWQQMEETGGSDERQNQPTIFNPYFIAKELFLYSPFIASNSLDYEALKRIALIAIAAEKYFLKNGSYPETLAELQIDFDITDVTDPKQRPLSYQLDKNGRPEIWSLHESQNSSRPQLRWQFWEKD